MVAQWLACVLSWFALVCQDMGKYVALGRLKLPHWSIDGNCHPSYESAACLISYRTKASVNPSGLVAI